MVSFYLVSTELREAYEPRACHIIRRLRSELRDDLALVEIDPPLPRNTYDTEDEISQLILATRHEGTTLFPISNMPLPVYICRISDDVDLKQEVVQSGDISIIDWGEIISGVKF